MAPKRKNRHKPANQPNVVKDRKTGLSEALSPLGVSNAGINILAVAACSKEKAISRIAALKQAKVPLTGLLEKLLLSETNFNRLIERHTQGIPSKTLSEFRKVQKIMKLPAEAKLFLEFSRLSKLRPSNSTKRKELWASFRRKLEKRLSELVDQDNRLKLEKQAVKERQKNNIDEKTGRRHRGVAKAGGVHGTTKQETVKSLNKAWSLKISILTISIIRTQIPGAKYNAQHLKEMQKDQELYIDAIQGINEGGFNALLNARKAKEKRNF